MKTALRYFLPAMGAASIILFCVSANFNGPNAQAVQQIPESVNLLFAGLGLIGMASCFKHKK